MSRTVSIQLVERLDHTRILEIEDLRELALGDSIAEHYDFVRQPIFIVPLPKAKTFDHELGEILYHLLSTFLPAEGSWPGGEFPIYARHNGDNTGCSVSATWRRMRDIHSDHHCATINKCKAAPIKCPADSTGLAAEFQSQISNQCEIVTSCVLTLLLIDFGGIFILYYNRLDAILCIRWSLDRGVQKAVLFRDRDE
jgi:hypothetical protein